MHTTVIHGSEEVIEVGPSDVHRVRCALGQSRADFARFFAVNWETVLSWETGERLLTRSETALFIRLAQQADVFSEKTMLRPAMETALRERKLGQIHESELRL